MSNRAPSDVTRPGPPGDAAVDRVEHQGDGGQGDQDRRSGPDDERVRGQRSDRTRHLGADQRHAAGRTEPRGPVPDQPRVERHTEGRAAEGTDGPADGAETDRGRQDREQREQPDEPGERSGLNPIHRASVCREYDVDTTTGRNRFNRRGRPVTTESAFWVAEPGRGEIRTATLREPRADEVLVRTTRSAVSRGTETLVFRGGVPVDQHSAMRAPFQEGDFPGPVKYGYLNVGVVEQGPAQLPGRTVFCLHPHQTAYVVPATAVTVVPDGVPPERAVLAGTVETAVNALWDAAPLLGDRVAVVGAGMVGCCVARLLAGIPGVRVTLVDTDPARATTAAALGVAFAPPADAPGDCDLVVHASATSAGLQTSLDLLAAEGTVVDLGWYGDAPDRALARRRLPLAAPDDPRQPGGCRRARPSGPSLPRRPARPGTGPAARPGLRRPADRLVAVPRPARGDGRHSPTGR